MDQSPRPGTTPSALTSSFLHFVTFGGGVGLASGAAVAVLAGLLPFAVANAPVAAVSTVLATELRAASPSVRNSDPPPGEACCTAASATTCDPPERRPRPTA
ncbi:hypothetical protein [Streptomyces sp. NPDC057695]|uniref:hypothetical protein n=1 Tax=Streptomyces sp. NPDC057695 TaxID=3346217 RepID=UPI0036B25055